MRKRFQNNYPTEPPMQQVERVVRNSKQRYQRVIPTRAQNKRNQVRNRHDTEPVSHSAPERPFASVVEGHCDDAQNNVHAEEGEDQ
jgi:hypothetical protein